MSTLVPFLSVRRFIAWLRGMPLVVLQDFDGETVLRLAHTNYLGELSAVRMGFGIRTVGLLPNGKVSNGCYVARWVMVKDYRRNQ